MITTVTSAIGPGRDYPTLAAWAEALPPDLTVRDEAHVAELYAGPEDPGGAVIRTRCDQNRAVTIRSAAGHGFAALSDPVTDPLAPGQGLGAAIRCVSGDAIRAERVGTRVTVEGLQILAEDGAALADDELGAIVAVNDCLIDALSVSPAVTVCGPDARLTGTCLIQRGHGDGAWLARGACARAVSVLKPPRPVAEGTGIAGSDHGLVESAAVFGFRRAFGPGICPGQGTASDQSNTLAAAADFSASSWQPVRAGVNPVETLPGPFARPLQWLSNNQAGFARFEHEDVLVAGPGEKISLQVLVAAPTALSSGIALVSAPGEVALKVNWVDTPPSTALVGHPAGLAAVEGGLEALAPGLYRLAITAQNRTGDTLEVQPVIQVTAGLENAGLNVGLYAGCVMAGPGHLGNGFIEAEAAGLIERPGIDPELALRSASGILPDLRPVEGGPLDLPARTGSPDIFGRPRLAPETIGAVTLNPAPRFVAQPLPPRAPSRRAPCERIRP